VAEGYFPAKAEKVKVTEKMTVQDPGRVTVKNSRFVKLGLDTDRWVRPVLNGLYVLLALSLIAAILIAGTKCRERMKKHQENSKERKGRND